MAVAPVTVYWEDASLRTFVQTFNVEDTQLGVSDADLIAFLQSLQNLSQARIIRATIAREVVVSGLTGGAATTSGSFDSVGDRAILQFAKTAATGSIQLSVPAPLDTIFQASGAYALADVDPSDSLVQAMEAAGPDTDLLVTSEGGTVTFRKGWRQGQKHS